MKFTKNLEELQAKIALLEQENKQLKTGVTKNLVKLLLESIQNNTGIEDIGLRLNKTSDFQSLEISLCSPGYVLTEQYQCVNNLPLNSQELLEGPHLTCMCENVLTGNTDPALPYFSAGGSFWTNNATHLFDQYEVRTHLFKQNLHKQLQ